MYKNMYHLFRSAIKTSSCVCRWLNLFVIAAVLAVSYGQGTVTVSPDVTVDNGSPTTLSCKYSIDSNYLIYNLEWRRGDSIDESLSIADFVNDVDHPIYYNNFSSSDYTASRDKLNTIASLAIAAVSFQDDSGLFWCIVQVFTSGGTATSMSASIEVIVTVLPTSITISDKTGTYPAGGTSYLIEGEECQYTCVVPDINPGATFTWTVGGRSLTPDGKSNITGSNNLTTSSSTTTITAVAGNDGEMLQCKASNKNGHDGVSTTVVLDVKVPPKASSMLLLGSSGPLGDPADVDEGTSHTFTCRVLGTKPAATIRWFLDNVEQTTTTTTPGAGNGLVDTESQWTFTSERVNHRQMVKCEANTAESQPPFPSVSTTLNVIGPPDTPEISGSLTMTENEATSLTCTADMGYPDDWDLVWSYEGTAIENPPATTAVLGTSQRYNFTSQLKFTPQRQNNTHIIKCVTSSPSWTSKPLPEETWVPINVQYATHITNKHQTDVGVKSGVTANLSCTAKGNPAPVITWFNPDNAEIINGGNEDRYMVVVSHTTSDADLTVGNVTTSKLSIRAVDAMVDYGVYTCNSNNSIGQPDTHKIILNGTRRPNQPTGVVLVDRTSSFIAIRWTAGYDGGEPQWFNVSHKKTADSSETVSDRIDGEVTTYNVTGLESYTEYEIKVYAENDLGRNPSPGSVVNYTLPESITEKGITIEFYKDEGKVKVTGVKDSRGCIQLEVKYESSKNWTVCVKCITADSEVVLAGRCPQTNNRSRRAVGDVVKVQAKYCKGSDSSKLCSDPVSAEEVSTSPEPTGSDSTGIIVGGVVGGIFLLVIIGILIVYLKRTSPDNHKPTYTDTSSIELATNNFGQNGEVNEGLQSSGGAETNARPAVERMVTDTGDTYAIVKKDKSISKPPPQNLPDVTNAVYAAVNKKTPVSGLGKKPKKYVPPSRVNEESEYDDVKLPQSMIGVNEESEYEDVKLPQQNMKSKIGAGSSGYEVVNLDSPKTPVGKYAEEDDYANLDQCKTNSGRTVDSDGLIYMEVGHLKTHPANQPPIQTEESTTYASIDFKQLVPPDVARK